MTQKLDYKKMLKDIDNLVNNDTVFSLEVYRCPTTQEFKQEEVNQMLDIILDVYKISHTLHCKACRKSKYLLTTNNK